MLEILLKFKILFFLLLCVIFGAIFYYIGNNDSGNDSKMVQGGSSTVVSTSADKVNTTNGTVKNGTEKMAPSKSRSVEFDANRKAKDFAD